MKKMFEESNFTINLCVLRAMKSKVYVILQNLGDCNDKKNFISMALPSFFISEMLRYGATEENLRLSSYIHMASLQKNPRMKLKKQITAGKVGRIHPVPG
jgi:hypothetical protein